MVSPAEGDDWRTECPKDPSLPRCSSTSQHLHAWLARNHQQEIRICQQCGPAAQCHHLEISGDHTGWRHARPCLLSQKMATTIPFHLNTKEAGEELVVHITDRTLPPCANPRYLGVTLDRTLSFKQHVSNICTKLSARNSIICRLCGTTWGAFAATLRTVMQAIVITPAEYCAPTWERSSHCRKLDTCLNTVFWTISGCLQATPVDNLPVLAGIAPPRLCRKAATIDTITKAANNPNHLLYDCVTKQRKSPRLKSRKPFHREVEALRLDTEEEHPGKKWLRDRGRANGKTTAVGSGRSYQRLASAVERHFLTGAGCNSTMRAWGSARWWKHCTGGRWQTHRTVHVECDWCWTTS